MSAKAYDNSVFRMMGYEQQADVGRILHGPSMGVEGGRKAQKNKLTRLHETLKRDQADWTKTRDSAGQGASETPTPEMAELMAKDPTAQQYNSYANALGDYSLLVQQFPATLKTTSENAFIVTSLDSRTNMAKIEDDTNDGYNLLSNQFGIMQQSEKSRKKAKGEQRLAQFLVSQ